MSIDGTWDITVNTPMGAQQSTIAFTTDGDTLSGDVTAPQPGSIYEGKVDGDSARVEDRHHRADGPDRPLPGDGRRRLALGHRERRPVPALAGHRAARLTHPIADPRHARI